MAEQVFVPVQLLAKQTIAKDTIELRFTKPVDFTFLAGQFVQFQIPDGEKHVLRSYSISSTPGDKYLEFCVKILPDGKASQFFDQIVFGNTAYISSAKGRFVCDSIGPNYFIATGAGLAPVMGMITQIARTSMISETAIVGQGNGTALLEKVQTTMLAGANHVLFGVRHKEDLFWLDRFEKLQKQYIACTITLTQPSEDWTGFKGRVTEHLVPDITGHYYLCGSLPMVKDVRAKLSSAGISAKNIHFEIF